MKSNEANTNLRIVLDTHGLEMTAEEIQWLSDGLGPLRKMVADFPVSDLYVTIEHHPRSGGYKVKTSLVLTGQTLVGHTEDAQVHPAYERCVASLVEQTRAYKERLGGAEEQAKQQKGTYQEVLPDHEPDPGALERSVREGDYSAFRTALLPYEEPLRRRVGRWVARYPEADARIGSELTLADIVEAVFLNAFEGFDGRPREVRLGQWLEGLIDSSLRALLRDPDAELENVRFVRTLRDAENAPE